jgi:hypothetical protein
MGKYCVYFGLVSGPKNSTLTSPKQLVQFVATEPNQHWPAVRTVVRVLGHVTPGHQGRYLLG